MINNLEEIAGSDADYSSIIMKYKTDQREGTNMKNSQFLTLVLT